MVPFESGSRWFAPLVIAMAQTWRKPPSQEEWIEGGGGCSPLVLSNDRRCKVHPAHWAPFVAVGEGRGPTVSLVPPTPAKKPASKERGRRAVDWTVEFLRQQ